MNVVFFATKKYGDSERLQQRVEAVIPAEDLEICRTLDSLSKRFRKPFYNSAVAVLFAAGEAELSSMLSFGELLSDIRIILVIPDREDKTVSRGHMLYPRFLSYADSDFRDVAAVLRKMLEIQHCK